MRKLVVLLSLIAFASCGGDSDRTCDLTGSPTCTISMKTGEMLRVKLPPPRQFNTGDGSDYQWTTVRGFSSDVVRIEGEPTDSDGDDLKDTLWFRAIGPGSTTIVPSEVNARGEIGTQTEVFLTVAGEPIDGAGSADYLVNIEIAGGFGTSRESGTSFEDLALYPTDLIAEGEKLYMVSEGTLWHLDTLTETGTIEIDASAAGTAWPAGGTLISIDPLSDGTIMALIDLGTSLSIVKIAADGGSYEELFTATQTDLRPGCMTCEANEVVPTRIRANSDGSSYVALADSNKQILDGVVYGQLAQGRTAAIFDGMGQLAPESQVGHGVDSLGRILYWDYQSQGYLYVRTGGEPFPVFTFTGTKGGERVVRETDFRPFGNLGAPVWEVGAGTYWSYSFYDEFAVLGPYSGRGLFVHRP